MLFSFLLPESQPKAESTPGMTALPLFGCPRRWFWLSKLGLREEGALHAGSFPAARRALQESRLDRPWLTDRPSDDVGLPFPSLGM